MNYPDPPMIPGPWGTGTRPDPAAWRLAVGLADGDLTRVTVDPDGTVTAHGVGI